MMSGLSYKYEFKTFDLAIGKYCNSSFIILNEVNIYHVCPYVDTKNFDTTFDVYAKFFHAYTMYISTLSCFILCIDDVSIIIMYHHHVCIDISININVQVFHVSNMYIKY